MDEECLKLSVAALPPARETLDDRILAGLVVRKAEAAATRRLMAVAALFSLGGGIVAGSAFVPSAIAASPLTPLIPDRKSKRLNSVHYGPFGTRPLLEKKKYKTSARTISAVSYYTIQINTLILTRAISC